MTITATQIDKAGSTTTWIIEGASAEEIAIAAGNSTVSLGGDERAVKANNKSEAAKIHEVVAAMNAEAAKAKNQPAANERAARNGGRYVELLEVAERDGLNHGKSWIASGYDVDAKSLHPSWEGEAICYVYAD